MIRVYAVSIPLRLRGLDMLLSEDPARHVHFTCNAYRPALKEIINQTDLCMYLDCLQKSMFLKTMSV